MYEEYFVESDWKMFNEKIAEWQEKYMEKLLKEYKEIISRKEEASKRFWELEQRIKKDKNNPGVLIVSPSRSKLFFILVDLINDGVISFNDLKDFSNKLIDNLHRYLSI